MLTPACRGLRQRKRYRERERERERKREKERERESERETASFKICKYMQEVKVLRQETRHLGEIHDIQIQGECQPRRQDMHLQARAAARIKTEEREEKKDERKKREGVERQ